MKKKTSIYIIVLAAVILGAAAIALWFFRGQSGSAVKPLVKTGSVHIVFHAGEIRPQKIEASVIPRDAGQLAFTSSNTDIASVDGSGNVTPSGKIGETTVTVTCGEGSAQVAVSTVDNAAESVELSEKTVTLHAGETASLTAAVYPSDADVKDVTWTSSNEMVAHADSDGVIYPCGIGTAEITAKTADGGFEAKCAVSVVSDAAGPAVGYKNYGITLYDFVMAHMKHQPVFHDSKLNPLPAHDEEVEAFANPDNFTSGFGKYQFLVLNEPAGIDADTLDMYFKGKGALEGMGSAIKAAADENNLSEVYLASLACTETECGTSELALGIEINGTRVYNPLGVCDTGTDIVSKAEFAYRRGWTSVERAIYGGAKWLSVYYINSDAKQNTLYKMRWNPANPSTDLYTDDVEWAQRYAECIGRAFELLEAEGRLEIPVFKNGRAVAG